MAMGTRKGRERQEDLWVAYTEMASGPGHPFYLRLNEVLDGAGFDAFVEQLCARFYADRIGRPGLTPGIYFRSLMISYFEGIEAERGIAWRMKDSLSLRRFVGIALDEDTPDHSTISRTRRLIDLETHQQVFSWVLGLLADRGLLDGKRIGIDATTLEASAAMRSIVRRDTGESYEEFLTGLAKASGIETPTREDLARLDRKRKKRTSNKEWMSPTDQDARVAKMKDGSTHLAHKAEHAVDLDTGAVVAVTLQAADLGDTTTIEKTLAEAAAAVAELVVREADLHPDEERRSTWKASRNWSRTRAIIAAPFLSRSRRRKFAPTFRRRSRRASGTGKASTVSSRLFIKTVNGCAVSMARVCCGGAASESNEALLIATRRAECGAAPCMDGRIFSNVC